MLRVLFGLVVVAGCSFRHGAASGPGDSSLPGEDASHLDGPADGGGDGSTSCLDRWHAGTAQFAAPTLMSDVSSSSYDRDPFLSPNELTIWLSSSRSPSQGDDLWTGQRTSVGAPFGTLARVTKLDSAESEGKVSMTPDVVDAVLASDRGGYSMLWEATRSGASASWGTPDDSNELSLDGEVTYDPFLSGDALRLYGAPAPTGFAQYIGIAARSAPGTPFSTFATITELYSGAGDADPTLSPDETVIVYSSQRVDGGFAQGNLWYAVRDSASGTFGSPQPVPDVNTDDAEGDPHLSSDGCRLYFSRYIASSGTDWDIYVAQMQ